MAAGFPRGRYPGDRKKSKTESTVFDNLILECVTHLVSEGVPEPKLILLVTEQANKLRDKLSSQGRAALFGKPRAEKTVDSCLKNSYLNYNSGSFDTKRERGVAGRCKLLWGQKCLFLSLSL